MLLAVSAACRTRDMGPPHPMIADEPQLGLSNGGETVSLHGTHHFARCQRGTTGPETRATTALTMLLLLFRSWPQFQGLFWCWDSGPFSVRNVRLQFGPETRDHESQVHSVGKYSLGVDINRADHHQHSCCDNTKCLLLSPGGSGFHGNHLEPVSSVSDTSWRLHSSSSITTCCLLSTRRRCFGASGLLCIPALRPCRGWAGAG